jgi:hypothetical protein
MSIQTDKQDKKVFCIKCEYYNGADNTICRRVCEEKDVNYITEKITYHYPESTEINKQGECPFYEEADYMVYVCRKIEIKNAV